MRAVSQARDSPGRAKRRPGSRVKKNEKALQGRLIHFSIDIISPE